MSSIKLRSVTLLSCLALALPAASAQAKPPYLIGVDQGVSPYGGGIVPVPGQGTLPFWGGNSFSWGGFIETAFADVLRAVRLGTDLTPAAYQFGGMTNIQLDEVQPLGFDFDAVGFVGGTCGGLCLPGPTHAALWNGDVGFTDLHDSSYVSTFAQGVDGSRRVAGAGTDGNGLLHPLYWDLNQNTVVPKEMPLPAGFTQGAMTAAMAATCFGAGYGTASSGQTHPLLWCKTGQTVTMQDMLPPGSVSAVVVAIQA